ncbi:MAG: DipZ protein [Thermoleophilia bacterium]|nr:DipZ protein [Thermoleophilia bacterium]
MRVTDPQIIAPDLPLEITWLNRRPASIDTLLADGPVLVEFWDFARVNSLRTLPYMEQWHRRYAPFGASVIGIHSPGYTFGADEDIVRGAVERLGVKRPVLLDPAFIAWRDYGNKGWPARYLWSHGGELRYYHYGEGDYEDCELALRDALAEYGVTREALPPPMALLRPDDAPGAEFPAQTADIALPPQADRLTLTGEWSASGDWLEARTAGAKATAPCSAAGAFAVLSGKCVEQPGVHETPIADGVATVTAAQPGLRLHGIQFTAVAG